MQEQTKIVQHWQTSLTPLFFTASSQVGRLAQVFKMAVTASCKALWNSSIIGFTFTAGKSRTSSPRKYGLLPSCNCFLNVFKEILVPEKFEIIL